MTLTALQSYRAECDEEGCETYINISLKPGRIVEGLAVHKWLVIEHNVSCPVETYCPKHSEEHR